MNPKQIILAVLCIISGIGFIAVGIYFLSKKFVEKLNESSPVKSQEIFAHNLFRSKGCGYTSIALGALTVMNGIMIFTFPALASILSFGYMLILIVAFLILTFVFK